MAKTPQPRRRKTLRLVEKPDERPQKSPGPDGRRIEDLIASTFSRWRGHEPEIAVLSATTFILAIAAVFAGSDLLFTLLVVGVAAVTIWSPWRNQA